MQKILCLLMCLCVGRNSNGQPKKISKNQFADSISGQWKLDQASDLPVTGFTENERTPTLPSPLYANRDVFMNTAGFHFSIVRFRFRGLDANYFGTEINGIPMNTAEDGITPWNLWSGLNDVTRNTQTSLGLRAAEFSFGNIGNSTRIDTRASRQRVQTQVGYAFSNRSFTHRWTFTHSSVLNKKGWAFTISGSFRYATEGYVAGSFYNGKSYFIAIDKKIGNRNLLSFNLFGSSLFTGKQSAVTEEVAKLVGTPYYNAYWGYQAGVKRNANARSGHQPVLIVRHDLQIDNHTSWTTAVAVVAGTRTDTGLDWYKAADPRPDYYRYLPGYQKDPLLQAAMVESISADKKLLQVNWDRLFETNRNSHETITDADGIAGNSVMGRRSHYIVENRSSGIQRFMVNSVYQSLPSDVLSFTAGASLQLQRTHNYKSVNDLLGGGFYVDWNQFAERDFPNDPVVIQNDTRRPNRILKEGDAFGYDYRVHTLLAKSWGQVAVTGKKMDYFMAAELGYTNYKREGLVANGLFPRNSLGHSFLHEFTGYSIKSGFTYKINGRKYLYLLAGYFVKAPLFDNVFISPKTRDSRQENIKTEKIISGEAGYIWNAPAIKMRLNTYLLQFFDGMNITTFYHDGYANFVNYGLSGINKIHYGIEAGVDISVSEQLSVNMVAAVGRYYYNNRQEVTVSVDNNASIIERGLIYSNNFRVAGTPQEAYGVGLNYQSPKFYCNLTASYFRQQWLEFNPLRRTYAAVKDIAPESAEWKKVIDQTVLPDQGSVDFSAGSSAKIRFPGSKKIHLLMIYIGVNNLLDNQKIISGGYEQMRFDIETKNIDKFPPKFYYAMGLNFSVNLTLRL